MVNNDKRWITLNVGGTNFITSKATLAKSTPPNSPLHRISTSSTNVQWDRDEKGAYLIDRDPYFFRSVLNYLRHGKLVLNRDMPEEGIIMEAEYFQLPELARIAKQRLLLRGSFLSQPEYLTSYVNNILEEGSITNQARYSMY